MSTMPPNVPPPPPGGVSPIPPYDPKAQYRAYREQQKEAWRAQKDAWKSQRYAWKEHYRAYAVPSVPSLVGPVILIAVGVIALLIMSGRMNGDQFWSWYGHWWPVLLIGAGLAMLGEWALDAKRQVPVRRSGGFIGILIFAAILGATATGWNHWLGPLHAQWGDHDDDFFNSLGLPEHDNEQHTLQAQVTPSSNINVDIENPRGDISITAADGYGVEVQAHEVAYARSDDDAKKIFDAEAASLRVDGESVLIKSDAHDSGRINLSVTVPRNAHVSVHSGKGDVTAAGLAGALSLATSGDVHLNSITGNVEERFSKGRHDFSAHDLRGDLSLAGDCNDITLSQIAGKVTHSGEIVGDVHMESISGAIHLHTNVTDLQVGELPGELTLNSDDLRVTDSKGQLRVTTHSKDVNLTRVLGDTYVENRDGRISIEAAGSYGIEARNTKGDVEVTLPPNVSAHLNANVRNGEIVSDFPLPANTGESANKNIAVQLGSGSARIALSAENGDVQIHKGSATVAPVAPVPPVAPLSLVPPKVPVAPQHGKASKTQTAQPVNQ